ncbi:5315_t:CDS:1, partial [Scutellospora calospora]
MSFIKKFTSKFNKKNQKFIEENNWNNYQQNDTPWNIEEKNDENSWDEIEENS